jgi:hypothetical protein
MATRELWAVLDHDGSVMWSRGGSSTRKKLMVYGTKELAERALSSPWIKQIIHNRRDVVVKRVYNAEER